MADALDALKHEAESYGLTHLTAEHLAQFRTAKAAAARFVSSIQRDWPVTVEPAHIFRASQEA